MFKNSPGTSELLKAAMSHLTRLLGCNGFLHQEGPCLDIFLLIPLPAFSSLPTAFVLQPHSLPSINSLDLHVIFPSAFTHVHSCLTDVLTLTPSAMF